MPLGWNSLGRFVVTKRAVTFTCYLHVSPVLVKIKSSLRCMIFVLSASPAPAFLVEFMGTGHLFPGERALSTRQWGSFVEGHMVGGGLCGFIIGKQFCAPSPGFAELPTQLGAFLPAAPPHRVAAVAAGRAHDVLLCRAKCPKF